MIKNILAWVGAIFPILVFIFGIFFAAGKLMNKAEIVDEVKVEVKEVERRLDKNEKFDMEQSYLIEKASDGLERQSKVLEKIEAKF